MIIIDKLKKNFGEKIAVDIEHYEINQGDMLGFVRPVRENQLSLVLSIWR